MNKVSPYTCTDIPHLQQEWPRIIPLRAIQQSSFSGCLLCPVLLAAIKPLIVDESSTSVEVSRGDSGLSLMVRWGVAKRQSSRPIELFCDEGEQLLFVFL
jgi:hypothetical protein